MARFDAQLQESRGSFEGAVGQLDPMPGVASPTTETIVAEIGTKMRRFPSVDHVASRAGVAPGNQESARKGASGKTRKGHRFLRTILVQAAHAAARTNGPSRSAQYRRLATRRGQTCAPDRHAYDARHGLGAAPTPGALP
jgi:transposase